MREGRNRLVLGPGWPKVLGHDFAGEVIATGPRAKRFQVGDAVYGMQGLAMGRLCHAHARGRSASWRPKPASLSFEEAAALPMTSLTSLQVLRNIVGVQAGQHLLVNGASGGVGSAAVQLGKILGAEVTGVCSARNTDAGAQPGRGPRHRLRARGLHGERTHAMTWSTTAWATARSAECKGVLAPRGVFVSVTTDALKLVTGPVCNLFRRQRDTQILVAMPARERPRCGSPSRWRRAAIAPSWTGASRSPTFAQRTSTARRAERAARSPSRCRERRPPMTNPSPASSKWSWRKRLLVGALATFAVMQLVPYGRDHENPPMGAEPAWDSPETRALFMTSCGGLPQSRHALALVHAHRPGFLVGGARRGRGARALQRVRLAGRGRRCRRGRRGVRRGGDATGHLPPPARRGGLEPRRTRGAADWPAGHLRRGRSAPLRPSRATAGCAAVTRVAAARPCDP
jgi:hypothetical protein